MADPANPFRPHEKARLSIISIGTERAPVIIVDDFLSNAEMLVDYAATSSAFRVDPGTYYPGARALIPKAYGLAVSGLLRDPIWKTFGKAVGGITVGPAAFSLVTTLPKDLKFYQRVPHTDGFDNGQIALLHYLCGPQNGGTSFYRHRKTGFEIVDNARAAEFERIRNAQWAANPPEARYIDGDNAEYERIHSIDAAFNRLIIYRSVSLHSGNIAADFSFDPNPRTGRLTANTFLHLG
jgi:hypothetical protein